MNRPFRILLVDDLSTLRGGDMTHPLISRIKEIGKKGGVEAFFSQSLLYLFEDGGEVQAITPQAAKWKPDYVWNLDVLILDLKGVELPREYELTKDDLPEATDDEIGELNNKFEGAAFYLKSRERLKRCQVVVILSEWDELTGQAVSSLKYLEKCCRDELVPWTLKFPMRKEGVRRLADMTETIFDAFSRGYTQLEGQGAIEFAASHDYPVLIVGESGTGKETKAQQIHLRWVQENLARAANGRKEYPERLTVVNCAGLSPLLAKSELFGHVKGSATTLDDHRIGKVLEACGCKPIRSSSKWEGEDWAEDFRIKFFRANGHILERMKTDDKPGGTLFLDEFAELPIEVQTLVLRYLENFMVEPLGYRNEFGPVIARIIAATSDPRVARLVGRRLIGAWRTPSEWTKPIRQDLIFRLKSQVIRLEPVKPENLDETLDHFISESTKPKWRAAAKKRLKELVGKQLSMIAEAEKKLRRGESMPEVPAFGHRREIKRVVKLANAYVETALDRGIRGISKDVTPEVVDKVWHPSSLAFYQAGIDHVPQRPRDSDEPAETMKTVAEIATYIREKVEHAVEAGHDIKLVEKWRGKDLKDLCAKQPKARETLRKVLGLYTGQRDELVTRALGMALGIKSDKVKEYIRGNIYRRQKG